MESSMVTAAHPKMVWAALKQQLAKGTLKYWRKNTIWHYAPVSHNCTPYGAEYGLHRPSLSGARASHVVAEINKEPDAAKWHALLNRSAIQCGLQERQQHVFVNLETELLTKPDYLINLVDPKFMFDVLGLRNRVVLEVTERAPVSRQALIYLMQLQGFGYKLALDDVGKGFHNPNTAEGAANLQTLGAAGLHWHAVKIDRTLVENLADITQYQHVLEVLQFLHLQGISPPLVVLEGHYPEHNGWWHNVCRLAVQLAQGNRALCVSGVEGSDNETSTVILQTD